MNKRPQGVQVTIIGSSSLLVIFTVLCLTVFALLGLSTVQANSRLQDSGIQSTLNYYQADTQAEEILSQLRQNQIPSGVILQDNSCYHYNCPISENQTLSVTVQIQENDYTILQWKVISETTNSYNEQMNVWDGE